MFWARVDAFDEILSRHIIADDFELERGQLWDTLAHFLERDFWINIQNRYGEKAISFSTLDGEVTGRDLKTSTSNDLELVKVMDRIDKTGFYSVDKNIKVSVIITNYNYGRYLEDSIKSVLKQTFTNIDLHIVDDGSTDELSSSIIKKYSNKYPNKVFGHMLKHQGVVGVRNYSLDIAKGDFIIFLDADDLMPRDYVEKMLEEAVYGNFDVVYSDMHNFGEDFQINVMPEFNRQKMIETNIVNMSALIRRKSIGSLKFDEYLSGRKLEDWDFFLGLMHSGAKFAKTGSTFLRYRIHTGQRNNNLDRDEAFWAEHNKTVHYIKNKYEKMRQDKTSSSKAKK
jgi:glycosyltransferase involved in cell wall biosynthesis